MARPGKVLHDDKHNFSYQVFLADSSKYIKVNQSTGPDGRWGNPNMRVWGFTPDQTAIDAEVWAGALLVAAKKMRSMNAYTGKSQWSENSG